MTNGSDGASVTHVPIHPDTTIGEVALTVADLDRSERFYCEVLGFKRLDRGGSTLRLSAGGERALVVLHEVRGAQRKPQRSTGLYHFAVLVPSRQELARSLRQLMQSGWALSGASDHLVSEAVYLDDPDGNGIEMYCDRARALWSYQAGQVRMAVEPLDVDGVMSALRGDVRPWDGLHPDTTIGHVHLHVANLRAARGFYCDLLGFDVVMDSLPQALFISAGGYHHHVGLNTWAGVGAPPPPPMTAGLRSFAVVLPDAEALRQVVDRVQQAGVHGEAVADGMLLHDPSQNGVVLTIRSRAGDGIAEQ